VDLVPGSRVQVLLTNLPPNVEFALRMGAGGSKAVGGAVLTHITSPDGGPVALWLEVLSGLSSSDRIDIRLENAAGLSAVTSFANAAIPAPAPLVATAAVCVPNPRLTVLHVQKGGFVNTAINGLPAFTNYSVSVGTAGSQGLGGYLMAHLNTGDSGCRSLIGTFEIPVLLRGEPALDLRLEAAGAVHVLTFRNDNY
jgi:hypothetical protein